MQCKQDLFQYKKSLVSRSVGLETLVDLLLSKNFIDLKSILRKFKFVNHDKSDSDPELYSAPMEIVKRDIFMSNR
jgi:hypothetical protein